MGWWTFDEGVGNAAADASGFNHPAALVSGPAWTAGRLGGSALSLDGINEYAEVAGFTALNGASAATVALWVYPRATDRPIISQWDTGRLFEFNGFQNGITVYWRYGGSGGGGQTLFDQSDSGSLALNRWQHVVVVYSSPTTATYVDGLQVSSSSGIGGPLNTGVSTPLQIGRNNTPAYLNGIVDDVRMYNRALSVSEIQELFNYTGDGTPPSVSVSSPSAGSTVANSITVSASAADNVGVVGVQFRLDGANLGAEDLSAPYALTWNTTTVPNASHTLSALARDAAGNQTTAAPVTVTVSNPPADTTPPVISNGSPSGTLPVGTTQATLSVTTSENATCRYAVVAGTAYAAMTGTFSTTGGTGHSATVSGLADGQTYRFYVRAQDPAGNATPTDYLVSFSVATSSGSGSSVIIDHTSVDLFDSIPDAYIELVKSQRTIASYLGASHATQMHHGLELLAALDARYAAAIGFNPSSYPNANTLRDLTGKYTAQYNSWSDTGGADTYWLDAAARQTLIDTMQRARTVLGYPVSVSLFGWSYHMSNPAYATDTLGHPMSDADVQLYLDVLSSFNSDPTVNATAFVYHTSVTDGSSLANDTSYNMNRWNDMIRQAAASQDGILFDQADIESWNNSNTSRRSERDYAGRTVYRRNADYQEVSQGGPGPDTYTGDHGNDALELRKAKALWVLLARLAGWDGNPQQAWGVAARRLDDPSIRLTGRLRESTGSLLIEFDTVTDQTYYVQYSDDLQNWETVQPAVIGTGSRMQWIDNGPPDSPSGSRGPSMRLYRLALQP